MMPRMLGMEFVLYGMHTRGLEGQRALRRATVFMFRLETALEDLDLHFPTKEAGVISGVHRAVFGETEQ
jgi:hypothetical protein